MSHSYNVHEAIKSSIKITKARASLWFVLLITHHSYQFVFRFRDRESEWRNEKASSTRNWFHWQKKGIAPGIWVTVFGRKFHQRPLFYVDLKFLTQRSVTEIDVPREWLISPYLQNIPWLRLSMTSIRHIYNLWSVIRYEHHTKLSIFFQIKLRLVRFLNEVH